MGLYYFKDYLRDIRLMKEDTWIVSEKNSVHAL